MSVSAKETDPMIWDEFFSIRTRSHNREAVRNAAGVERDNIRSSGSGKDLIYPYAMNEQIHELYRLENYFRAGVSVATDSIDWRIAIADIFCEGSQGKCHQEKRRGRSFTD